MIDRAAIAAFCDEVVRMYDVGGILPYLRALDSHYHDLCGTRFSKAGICYLLDIVGPIGALELFAEFVDEEDLDPTYPVAGMYEFEYNDNLWAGDGSNHRERVDLLRDFSKWLKGQA